MRMKLNQLRLTSMMKLIWMKEQLLVEEVLNNLTNILISHKKSTMLHQLEEMLAQK